MDRYPDAISSLPCRIGPDGTRFFVADEAAFSPETMASQRDFAAPRLVRGQTLLKEARQRFIYRDDAAPGVIKLFPLPRITSQVRHAKYGYREFSNMRRAAAMGISVPAAVAFVEKRRWGLVTCSGLVQEDLRSHGDLKSLVERGTLPLEEALRIAARAISVLYRAGVNHVDLRDENIMVDQSTGDWRIIDWQYASFLPPKAPWLLEYMTGYFLLTAPQAWRASLAPNWVARVHAENTPESDLKTFRQRVDAVAAKRRSLRDRLAAAPF